MLVYPSTVCVGRSVVMCLRSLTGRRRWAADPGGGQRRRAGSRPVRCGAAAGGAAALAARPLAAALGAAVGGRPLRRPAGTHRSRQRAGHRHRRPHIGPAVGSWSASCCHGSCLSEAADGAAAADVRRCRSGRSVWWCLFCGTQKPAQVLVILVIGHDLVLDACMYLYSIAFVASIHCVCLYLYGTTRGDPFALCRKMQFC